MKNLPLNELTTEIIVWGGADQAQVIRPIIQQLGGDISIIIDDTKGKSSPFTDIDILCGEQELKKWLSNKIKTNIGFIIAIGNPFGKRRVELHEYLSQQDLNCLSIAHNSAIIGDNVKLGPGIQIMPGAIIHNNVTINKQCIINTGAIVEHDNYLGDGVEIAPGATLCGRVTVDDYAWVCANATVLPRIYIGKSALIAAGAVIRKDVANAVTIAGNPGKVVTTKIRNK